MKRRYEFLWDGEMPSTIIEVVPFVDKTQGTDHTLDRKTGHTVNIYGNNISESYKRDIFLSFKYRRICPEDAYFLEDRKEIYPIIKVFPIEECPIYEELIMLKNAAIKDV